MSEPAPMFTDDEIDAMTRDCATIRPTSTANDALTEFREFHGWTLNKLDVLTGYLALYRRVAGGGTFIDAFAGTGRGITTLNGSETLNDGSALIAARSGGFSRMHLIEIDTNSLEALGDSVATLTPTQASKITIHPGDCNQVIPALTASGSIDTDKPCFALLDQDSTQLDWRTIETLAAMKTYEPPPTLSGRPKKCKTELWILFNSHQAVYRLWPSDRRDDRLPPGAGALDRMFGERSAWHDLWQDARPPSSLVLRYSDRLRDLDYQYVHPQLINDPTTGRPQYYMIHATDHPSAVSFMRSARRRSTPGFLDAPLPGM